MKYIPDKWLLLKITYKQKEMYKIFGSWSGGYLTGDSWRLNSGVISVKEDDKCYYFYGNSGSLYQCDKESYGNNLYGARVISALLEKYPDNVKVLSEFEMKEYVNDLL